ncbi:MAG: hypothetical protein ACI9WC_000370 [Arenicella sp.]|jgi:hypothetical protein
MENQFTKIVSVLMFAVFLIVALVCTHISIGGLINGMPLAPTAGLFLFGLVFVGLAFSSKDIAKLCS